MFQAHCAVVLMGAFCTMMASCGNEERPSDVELRVTRSSVGSALSATYDSVLRAPKCLGSNSSCDSGTLLVGRANVGPELHQPNTINGTCVDGTSGVFHSDESLDSLRVVTVDGTPLAQGKQVRIEATVWAYVGYSSDKLDLYYAANANSPTWQFITTLTPTRSGAQTLTAQVATLPVGQTGMYVGGGRFSSTPPETPSSTA